MFWDVGLEVASLRVHDIKGNRQALDVTDRFLYEKWSGINK